jgi:hypothetical protein
VEELALRVCTVEERK